ncbi:MAG: hypothetical protein J7493_09960 [Porphyrobacter sp.]|nr:hypothetical protein [Porphyrobacter sp.]
MGLLALVLLLIASALVPIRSEAELPKVSQTHETSGTEATSERDDDLALYDRAAERIRKGENYYDFIVGEQRLANYPVTPGLAVRLPTLAYVQATLSEQAQFAGALLLLVATIAVWWRRLGEEPGWFQQNRLLPVFLILALAPLGLNSYYFAMHELWAGKLMALSLGLHRPGKWTAALVVAALALAIREHALPFVLLMGAMALWRRDWRESIAWAALALAFLVALAVHLHVIAAQTLPSDPPSPSWLAMRGLSGWLSNLVFSSPLYILPDWIAGPVLMLAMAGWAGWRSPLGTSATFLYFGYGLAFMIAGRSNNFYWGAVVTPAMLVGLAFAPNAIRSLLNSALRQPVSQLALAK